MSEMDLQSPPAPLKLRQYQASFVNALLETETPVGCLLTAPTGTGKMFAVVASVGRLVARGANHILVLAPNTALCEQWRERLREAQVQLPAVGVTRYVYREMVAAVPIGQSPWTRNAAFVISHALAEQADILDGLSSQPWDLIVVDDAHRMDTGRGLAAIRKLVTDRASRRYLLLTGTLPQSPMMWLRSLVTDGDRVPMTLFVTSWHGQTPNALGVPLQAARPSWKIVAYMRGSDEMHFLQAIEDLSSHASEMDEVGRRLRRQLPRRASSCLFSAEPVLQKWARHELFRYLPRHMNIAFGAAPFERVAELDEVVRSPLGITLQTCLEALDNVTADAKLETVLGLLGAAANTHLSGRTCIVSAYTDTAHYVYSALASMDHNVVKITARDRFHERRAAAAEFYHLGGILVATDSGMGEGDDLPQIDHVIHYDVRSSRQTMDQRIARFSQISQPTMPLMYLLRDSSGVLPFETQLIDRIASEVAEDET